LAHDGQFLGGLILPGLDLMSEALARGTAGLTSGHGAVALFPRTTADAIASGAVQSICGAIERMERVLAQRDTEPQILLTGGGAEVIRSHLARTPQLVPNLVLEGLRIVAGSELE
jgi:type III pantothenate kinase